MELKVWVDGIQKVVCGVSYNTTCQDVVLALACSLGQTGRFSLVEKWRGSERPLIPTECPLQSLHKLGEYAGEVRYYLIQAGMDNAGQSQMIHQKENVSASDVHRFRHNFKLPDKSPLYLHSPELVKRSSTFSGAHQSLYGTLPKSSRALAQERCTQALVRPTLSSAEAKELDSGIYATSNGKPGGLSLNPITSSSLRTFHSNPGKAHQPKIESSQQHYPSSSRLDHPIAMIKPQQRQLNASPQLPGYVTKKSDQQSHPVPSPRHHVSSPDLAPESLPTHVSSPVLAPESLPTHVRLKDTQKPRQEQHLQSSSACVPHPDMNFATRSTCSDGLERSHVNASGSKVHANHPTQHGQADHPTQHGHTDTTSHHKPSSILRIAREYLQKTGNIHKLENPSEHTQSVAKLKNTFECPSDVTTDGVKYATLGRNFTRSKPHPALPSRSLSIGHGDEDQRSDSKQLIRLQLGSNGDCLQHCVDEKTSHVTKQENSTNSSVTKQENSTNSSVSKKMSSFASAVAHVRKHNGSVANNNTDVVHIRQHSENSTVKPVKTGSHMRQHSSDSSYTDSCLKGVPTPIDGHVQTVSAQRLIGISNNPNYTNASLQQSNLKPSLSFSGTSLLPKSAPTTVCRQYSHQESYLPQSRISVPSNKFSENIRVDRIGSSTSNNYISSNKCQESSHPEEVQLECEESGCDQHSPDMLTKKAAKYKGANNSDKLGVSRQVEVTSNQADREYSQLLRTVEVQQERLKLQEAHINDAEQEITSLEEKEVRNKEKLQAIMEEISRCEGHEAMFNEELDDLDKADWISVFEKEKELDANMNLEVTSLKAKLEQLESQIKKQKDEEDKKSSEIISEKEREAQERKQHEEVEKQVTLEKEELDQQLNKLNEMMNEKIQLLENLEKDILEADTVLNQKEEQVKSIEEELKTEVKMTYSQTKVHAVTPNSSTFSVSDSGEAILKILECQLSAQSPPTSPFIHEVDNLGGITSAQHLYTLGSTVKTAGGVWV